MSPILESPHFQFRLSADEATWAIQPGKACHPTLHPVRMHAAYTWHGLPFHILSDWRGAQICVPEQVASIHGALQQMQVWLPPDERGLQAILTFAAALEQPFFLWRLQLENTGREALQIERLTLLSVNIKSKIQNLRFFSNGWGSWNYSGAYGPLDRYRRTRLGFLAAPLRTNAGVMQPTLPGHFTSEMFGALGDSATRSGLLLGFLSQLQHFGSLEAFLLLLRPHLRLWANGDSARLDPGATMTTDWACLSCLDIDSPDPFGAYFQAAWRQSVHEQPLAVRKEPPHAGQALLADCTPGAARQSQSGRQPGAMLSGWCSWYQYFQQVSASDIRRNLDFIAAEREQLPLDLIQIDDGYQTQVGDWYSFRPGFPGGPGLLAQEICSAGLTPGLWLAPFIVDRRSQLAKLRPEWLLRGRFNKPANAGFIWNNLTTALDLTIPAALEYASQTAHTAVHEWGFPYLKLDFLYAAAIPGRRHDPTLTRAQTLRRGLEALRAAAGPKAFLLGCGCPLGPAIGLFEAMRIGADVAPNWEPRFLGWGLYFHKEPDYPSARNAIQNSLTRATMHQRWWLNDPDCLLARPSRLSLAEVQTLATVIGMSGGLLLLSDNLQALPPERMRLVQRLFPPIGQTPWVLDWLDSNTPTRLRLDLNGPAGAWHLLALFNWDSAPASLPINLADFQLDPGSSWFGRDFWTGEIYRFTAGQTPPMATIPVHGALWLALRADLPGSAQYLGSDLHFSQGMEVVEWQPHSSGLRLRLERPGRAEGMITLALPQPPRHARLGERPLPCEQIGSVLYQARVSFEKQAEIEIG